MIYAEEHGLTLVTVFNSLSSPPKCIIIGLTPTLNIIYSVGYPGTCKTPAYIDPSTIGLLVVNTVGNTQTVVTLDANLGQEGMSLTIR